MTRLRLSALVACAVLVLGCGKAHEVAGPNGPIIDGWPIGAAAGCEVVAGGCDELFAAATAALNARDGLPEAAVVSVSLHVLGPGALIRTTGSTVAVFVLADGTRRAIFVAPGFPPSPPFTFDYGP